MSQFTRGNFNLSFDWNLGVVNQLRGLQITMPNVDGVVYKMRNWIYMSAGVTGSCDMGIYDNLNLVPNSQTNIKSIASGNNLLYYDYVGKEKPILKANKSYMVIAHATQVGAGTFYLGGQSGSNNLYSYAYVWTDGTLPATIVAWVGPINYIPIIQVYMRMRGRAVMLSLGKHANARTGLGLETYLK